MLRSIFPVLAALAIMVIMAVVNGLVWDRLRPSSGGFAYLAFLTGYPWLWPNAPARFLVYCLPIWGVFAAIGYAVLWQRISGRPVRWFRVAALWMTISLLIGAAAFLGHSQLLSTQHAIAGLIWLYLIVGIGAVRDWVVR